MEEERKRVNEVLCFSRTRQIKSCSTCSTPLGMTIKRPHSILSGTTQMASEQTHRI